MSSFTLQNNPYDTCNIVCHGDYSLVGATCVANWEKKTVISGELQTQITTNSAFSTGTFDNYQIIGTCFSNDIALFEFKGAADNFLFLFPSAVMEEGVFDPKNTRILKIDNYQESAGEDRLFHSCSADGTKIVFVEGTQIKGATYDSGTSHKFVSEFDSVDLKTSYANTHTDPVFQLRMLEDGSIFILTTKYKSGDYYLAGVTATMTTTTVSFGTHLKVALSNSLIVTLTGTVSTYLYARRCGASSSEYCVYIITPDAGNPDRVFKATLTAFTQAQFDAITFTEQPKIPEGGGKRIIEHGDFAILESNNELYVFKSDLSGATHLAKTDKSAAPSVSIDSHFQVILRDTKHSLVLAYDTTDLDKVHFIVLLKKTGPLAAKLEFVTTVVAKKTDPASNYGGVLNKNAGGDFRLFLPSNAATGKKLEKGLLCDFLSKYDAAGDTCSACGTGDNNQYTFPVQESSCLISSTCDAVIISLCYLLGAPLLRSLR